MKYQKHRQYRHRIHDYTEEGYYFVTICTKAKQLFFGEIEGDGWEAVMEFSEIGRIAEQFWLEIPVRFGHVNLDEFVIMPNHIHGIINIDYSRGHAPRQRHAPRRVSTDGMEPLRKRIEPLRKGSLSSIINHYKGNVTKWCKRNGFYFAWQSRFHDRIIRDDRELNDIRDYIHINPFKWSVDINNPYN